jgi:hypothetical protein
MAFAFIRTIRTMVPNQAPEHLPLQASATFRNRQDVIRTTPPQ